MARKKKRKQTVLRDQSGITEAELQRRHDRSQTRWMVVGGIFYRAVMWIGLATCIYIGVYMPIAAAAGKVTIIRYFVNLFTDMRMEVVGPTAAGAAGWLWGYRWRSKCLRERKDKDDRIVELELQIDEKRSSSNLDAKGNILPDKENNGESDTE